MTSFRARRLLLVLVALVGTAVFGQTPTVPTAGSTSPKASSSTSSASVTTASLPAASAPLPKQVDLSVPSSVELLYEPVSEGLKQYGYETFLSTASAPLPRGRTPEPYLLGPGDLLTVLLWGDPVDFGELAAQYTITVAGDGTLFYPPVGQIRADGVARADAEKILINGLAKKYKRFDLRLQVSPQRVFPLTVTGLVGQPGIVMVDAWTSILEVLGQVGGVQKNGTLRNLRLVKADGREVAIDLYDLLVRARRPLAKIEEGDVLWVGPVGRTAAVFGQVKVPGIFEVKPGETVADVLAFAGGPLLSAVGAPLARIRWGDDTWVHSSLAWSDGLAGQPVQDGDVYSLKAAAAVKASVENPGFVQVGGEVASPGYLPWTPGLTMAQALAAVGGPTSPDALAGAFLTRDSIAAVQKKQIEQALVANNGQIASLTMKIPETKDALVLAALNLELSARMDTNTVLNSILTGGSLGRVQIDDPTGKSVLLQPGDALVIPRQSGVVYLFGEVYNPGAQLWKKDLGVRAAIDAVGGVKSSGDWDGVYVVRASGRVDSVSARGNFLGLSSLWWEQLRPGDMVYVPTKNADSSQGWAMTKDIVTLLAQTTTTVTNVFVLLKTLDLL